MDSMSRFPRAPTQLAAVSSSDWDVAFEHVGVGMLVRFEATGGVAGFTNELSRERDAQARSRSNGT